MKPPILPKFDRNNGWLEILPPLPPPNIATGDLKANIVVIGAGFTGLAAARRLAELGPEKQILLLEADRVGNTSAGRSSGFAIDQAHNIRAKDFAGNLKAEKDQLALNRAGQDYLREIVKTNNIECDWDESGKVHAAATTKGNKKLEAYAQNMNLLKLSYTWLNSTEMKNLTGSDFYKSGLHTPGTIMMQPAKLVLGLAANLPKNVILYENSPVISISVSSPHSLRTPKGAIKADAIVFANNGFAGQFGFQKKNLIPLITWGSLTRPLNKSEKQRLGGQDTWNIIPADPFGTSVRRIRGDRLLIRNIYNYSSELNAKERDRLWAKTKHLQSLKNRFPALLDLKFEYTWGGPLSLSRNGEPAFGDLAENVYGAFCLNGVGIARGTILGKLIAEYILGEKSNLLQIVLKGKGPNRLPPKPFLGWGVSLNFANRRRIAGLEL